MVDDSFRSAVIAELLPTADSVPVDVKEISNISYNNTPKTEIRAGADRIIYEVLSLVHTGLTDSDVEKIKGLLGKVLSMLGEDLHLTEATIGKDSSMGLFEQVLANQALAVSEKTVDLKVQKLRSVVCSPRSLSIIGEVLGCYGR